MKSRTSRAIRNPHKDPYPLTSQEVSKMYHQQGMSLQQIADQASTSRQRLGRWMNYWGIERRSSMEACKLKREQLGATRGPNWQGGRWQIKKTGTWFVYTPNHPKCRHNGGVEEHILIMESRLKRPLAADEVVHHRDGDHSNNDIGNLTVMTKSQHQRLHCALGRVGIELIRQGHVNLVLETLDINQQTLVQEAYNADYTRKSL